MWTATAVTIYHGVSNIFICERVEQSTPAPRFNDLRAFGRARYAVQEAGRPICSHCYNIRGRYHCGICVVIAFVVALATALTVGGIIVFHYEVIRLLNRWYRARHNDSSIKTPHRPTILGVIFILLFAHVAEIWFCGATFWLLLTSEGYGTLSGYPDIGLLDCVYFSAATYTTVGWGDLAATGHIRFLAGTEALVGFMMVTWSASFSYLIMARAWGNGADEAGV